MNDLRQAAEMALEALKDMNWGWKYIRESHGDLYGVGWDRAQGKADDAIEALRQALSQPEKSQTAGYAKKIEQLIKERDELRQALAEHAQPCCCGEPDALGVVHRKDNPCYVAQPEQKPEKEKEPAATSIHYPDCWDTACYPTLRDAIKEIGSFKCTNDDCSQPEQEPFCYHDGRNIVGKEFADHSDVFPLYTAPPLRQWQGLTKEDLFDIANVNFGEPDLQLFIEMGKLVQEELKEKNT